MDFRIYSRKSVYTGKGESIENQVEMCKAYLYSNYEGVSEADITVYEDEGFSGKNMDRPQFRTMLKEIREKKPDCIVCYRLDRISRNVGDFAHLIEQLNRSGIAFVCIKEKFDTGTPMGKAMMYIASVFAQLERETIAERVRDNMMMLARMGRWLGGQTPTGFTSEKMQEVILDGKKKTSYQLKVDEKEMMVVRLIYEKMQEVQSINGVRKYLVNQGIKSRTGKDFSLLGVKEILQNPVYCTADRDAWEYFSKHGAEVCFEQAECGNRHGLLAYNKRDYTKEHAPRQPMDRWIVAVGKHIGQIRGQEWVAIQTLLEANKRKEVSTVVHNDYSLLSGMIYCNICGSRMFAKRRSNHTERFDYICSRKMQLSQCDCPNLNGLQMDDMVYKLLVGKGRPNLELCRRLEELSLVLQSDAGEDRYRQLENKLRTCEQEMDRLVEVVTAENLEPAIIRRINTRAAVLEQERQTLLLEQKELQKAKEEAVDGTLLHRLVRTLISWEGYMDFATIYEKRALVRLLVQRCEWDGKELHVFEYGNKKQDCQVKCAPNGIVQAYGIEK